MITPNPNSWGSWTHGDVDRDLLTDPGAAGSGHNDVDRNLLTERGAAGLGHDDSYVSSLESHTPPERPLSFALGRAASDEVKVEPVSTASPSSAIQVSFGELVDAPA